MRCLADAAGHQDLGVVSPQLPSLTVTGFFAPATSDRFGEVSNIYQLGNTPAIDLVDDSFKRHVFSATVRLVNPSGRRAVP